MSKYLLGAAAAAFLMVGSYGAQAGHTPPSEDWTEVSGSECGFTAKQIADGFKCYQESSVSNVSREIGGGSRCQDATVTTTSTYAYNKNGHEMESRTEIGEPVESDWGASYSKPADGCNY